MRIAPSTDIERAQPCAVAPRSITASKLAHRMRWLARSEALTASIVPRWSRLRVDTYAPGRSSSGLP